MQQYTESSNGRFVRYSFFSFPVMLTLIFVVVGIGIVIAGFARHSQHIALLQRGVSVRGTVVRIEDNSDSDGSSYRPIVRFTPTGSTGYVEFKGESSGNITENVGDSVPVLYLPEDAQNAQIESDAKDWKGNLYFILFGAGFALMGGLAARQMMRGYVSSD